MAESMAFFGVRSLNQQVMPFAFFVQQFAVNKALASFFSNIKIQDVSNKIVKWKVKYFFKKGTQGERKHTPYITPFKYGSHEIHIPVIFIKF